MSLEIALILELAAGIALPLSFPFVFAAIWLLAYRLSDKPLPAGSLKTVVIWAVLTIVVVPYSVGSFLLVAAFAHSEIGISVWILVGAAACLWISIVPILLYKTAVQASMPERDDGEEDQREAGLGNPK